MSKQQGGMRKFGEQPGRRDNDRWDDNITKLEPPPKRQPVLIRPVGGVFSVAVHYVAFPSQKSGDMTGFYTLCANWNLAEGVDEDNGCPICNDFHKYLRVSEDDKYLRMNQKFRHLFHAFHVTNIRDGVKDPAKRFGVVETHALGIKRIEEAVLLKGGVQPDDPKSGYCLNWLLKDSDKGSKFGNTETVFTGADKMQAREQESGVWQIRLGKKSGATGVMQDLAAAIPPAMPPDEMRQKLVALGLYTALERATGTSVSAGHSDGTADEAPPMGNDDSDWDEAQDGGSEDAGDDWDDAGTATDSFGDDEDADDTGDGWDDDEEDEANAGPSDADDDGDGDGWDDDEEGGDEDPEPAPPPSKKKGGKKGGGKKQKTAAKKKAAAPPPEEDPDDDDPDDDWENWDEDDE